MYQDFILNNTKSEQENNSENWSLETFSANIQKTIEKSKSHIDGLTKNTEEEFLSIGQNFQNYYQSAKDITRITKDITETISEKILKNGINHLNMLLLKIGDYFSSLASDIEGGEASLSEIQSVLANVLDELSGFKRIVKHLRMLGISTRIESARLNHDDADFSTLAENVEKLSSNINDKAAVIRERAHYLTLIVKETISRIIYLENKQREQTGVTLDNINRNLKELNEKFDLCSKKAEVITVKTSDIYQNISQVVSSIQFHDITRQQMEHVAQALNLLLVKLAENFHSEESLKTAFIYSHNVCKLQSMQLKYTKNELYSAVNSIISSLENIRFNVAEVFGEARNMLTENNESGSSNTLKEIEAGFSEISVSLDKDSGIRTELTNSMKLVVDTIRSLAQYINEIEEIGSEIELIALNSSIKAAHTGSEGAALGVLAESIQRLSNESKNQTKLVSLTLRRISDSSEKLYTSIENNSDNKSLLNLKQLASDISSQLDSLTALDKNTYLKLLDVKDTFEKLDEDIIASVSKIDVHKKTADVIASVTCDLDEIAGKIGLLVDPALLSNEEDLKELNYKYTMNSERKIHSEFLTSKATKQQLSLLSREDNVNIDNTGGDEDFGENVELF